MANKTVKTRVQHKRGTASDWSQATSFKPLDGELIIYKGDVPRLKVGDGTSLVEDLPFADSTTA